MRMFAIFGCLAGLVVGLACFTLVEFMCNLDRHMTLGVDITSIIDGRLFSWFFRPEVWAEFPAWPYIPGLINGRAGVLMLVMSAAVVYAARGRLRSSPALVGLTLLLVSAIPYSVGALMLSTNTEPSLAGPWIHFMLCALVYGSSLCVLFSIAQFRVSRSTSRRGLASPTPVATPAGG